MAMFSSPKKPKVPKAPTMNSEAVENSAAEAARRAMLAEGRSSTILTSGGSGLGNVGAQ